jgi:hypothetical protein
MNRAITENILEEENRAYRGSGGVSAENQSRNFRPAFQDTQTGLVYASCFRDGTPAPFHLLDGLPDELVVAQDPLGQRAALKASLVAGFIRDGRFYTRDEAATLTATREQADQTPWSHHQWLPARPTFNRTVVN